MDFVEQFTNKVRAHEASLDDVREYVGNIGISLAHLSDGYGSELFTEAQTLALEDKSDKLTNTSVGGSLPLIYWMVKEALGCADTARMSRSRERAEVVYEYARCLIDLAESEMQKVSPGTKDNLLEERNRVYEPLPSDGWLL